MAQIPKHNDLNALMDEGFIDGEDRDYLGYSGLGHPCGRYLWYGFRWAFVKKIPLRINRIFRRGDIEEKRVTESLAEKGCTIYEAGAEVVGVTGHAKGHIDGKAIGVPFFEEKKHLFECKTMKASAYVKYLKEGLRRYSPPYWQQIQSYMGHMKLDRCLYVVVNKDTEERDFKRIKFDKAQFKEGESKAFDIITSASPPQRMPVASKTYFECKWCDAYKQCWQDAPIRVTCRTCQHVEFEDDGIVSCSFHGHKLDAKRQAMACDSYELDHDI